MKKTKQKYAARFVFVVQLAILVEEGCIALCERVTVPEAHLRRMILNATFLIVHADANRKLIFYVQRASVSTHSPQSVLYAGTCRRTNGPSEPRVQPLSEGSLYFSTGMSKDYTVSLLFHQHPCPPPPQPCPLYSIHTHTHIHQSSSA